MAEGAVNQAGYNSVSGLSRISVIIPSLDPDEKLLQTVFSMHAAGFGDIVLVNDGSAAENVRFFEEAGKLPYCTVLTHPQNRGKGAALRTAFAYLSENRTELIGAVTVDGDGQHTAADALRCCMKLLDSVKSQSDMRSSDKCGVSGGTESRVTSAGSCGGDTDKKKLSSARRMKKKRLPLVIGARDFSVDGVPRRSAVGNRTTAVMMRLIFGLRISDTQTGLRVIPAEYFRTFLRFRGDRYEYETNMLLECKRFGIPIEEVPISTVYIDDNRGSHFHPVRDSLRVYGIMLKFMFSSMAATAVDYVVFNTVLNILDAVTVIASRHALIMAATASARIISSLFNFFFNSKVVFSCEKSKLSTILRYYAVCVPQLIVSGVLVSYISQLFGDSNIAVGIIKIFVDIFLFFISFRIQRGWVFAEKNTELALEEGSDLNEEKC